MVVMKGYAGYLWERRCNPSTVSCLDFIFPLVESHQKYMCV